MKKYYDFYPLYQIELVVNLILRASAHVVGKGNSKMFFLFLAFWILLNGKFTWEIFFFGLAISAAVFWFMCRFLDYSLKKEKLLLLSVPGFCVYFLVLVREIAKANMDVLKLILSPRMEPEPALIYFKTDLKTGLAKVLLANSITLTPGTMTVSLEDDVYCIHCLDKSFADGIEESVFVCMLRKLEEGWK